MILSIGNTRSDLRRLESVKKQFFFHFIQQFIYLQHREFFVDGKYEYGVSLVLRIKLPELRERECPLRFRQIKTKRKAEGKDLVAGRFPGAV